MLSLLFRLCEYVFRERDDHKIVRELSVENLKKHLCPTNHSDFVFLMPFGEPAVRAVIHEAKFQGNEKAWRLLGEILSNYLKHFPEETIIIPIPLSSARLRQRGYNQVTEVARRSGVMTSSKTPSSSLPRLRTDLLYRKRDTIPQTSLTRQERLKNVTDAFGVRNQPDISGAHIIVLDDVATTGATMKAAEATLRPLHPASITLLALAH